MTPAVTPRLSIQDPLIGQRIGGYRVVEPIGEGGMGKVYLLVHVNSPQLRCVLKVLHDSMSHVQLVDRFLLEARTAASFRHPNVIEILDYDTFPAGGRPYLVMPFLDGLDLGQYVARIGARCGHPGRISFELALPLLLQVCAALRAAHARGIIHRDLKPSNCYVVSGEEGGAPSRSHPRLILLDFGIAKVLDPALRQVDATQSRAVLGTPGYMAPEQARGLMVDHRADLYAFGVLAYEILTGRRPFHGVTSEDLAIQQVSTTPPVPAALIPDIPVEASKLIMQCLAPVPARRPQVVMEVAHCLIRAARNGREVAREVAKDLLEPSAVAGPTEPTALSGPASDSWFGALGHAAPAASRRDLGRRAAWGGLVLTCAAGTALLASRLVSGSGANDATVDPVLRAIPAPGAGVRDSRGAPAPGGPPCRMPERRARPRRPRRSRRRHARRGPCRPIRALGSPARGRFRSRSSPGRSSGATARASDRPRFSSRWAQDGTGSSSSVQTEPRRAYRSPSDRTGRPHSLATGAGEPMRRRLASAVVLVVLAGPLARARAEQTLLVVGGAALKPEEQADLVTASKAALDIAGWVIAEPPARVASRVLQCVEVPTSRCLESILGEASADRAVVIRVTSEDPKDRGKLQIRGWIFRSTGELLVGSKQECGACRRARLRDLVGEQTASMVQRARARIRPATLLVRSDPDGATIYIDGEAVGATEFSYGVYAGKHVVRLKRDGYREEVREVTVTDGEKAKVEVELRRVDGAGPGPSARGDQLGELPLAPSLVLPGLTIGAGAAIALAGIGVLVLDESDAPTGDKAARRRETTLAGISITSAGVLTAGIGAVWLFRRARATGSSSGVAPRPAAGASRGGAWLGLEGRF